MKFLFVAIFLTTSIYSQTPDELVTYYSSTVNDLLLDMDSKVTTYLANKTLTQLHKEFVYWEEFPPEEVLQEHLSPLKLIDQKNALNGIKYVGQKAIENFKVSDQEQNKNDLYERFGFGKHRGKLITFVIHIEYSQNAVDRGYFTAIITNGLKKCNAAIKVAKNIISKAAEFFSFNYNGYTVQLVEHVQDEL
jgi:hypothetical protein